MTPLLSPVSPFACERKQGVRRPLVMGILNVTPDSFHPASRVPATQEAIEAGCRMEEAGADILDIGGESTRPGSDAVAQEVELARVLPVLEGLSRRVRIPLSIDTRKAVVAERAFECGATILNDIFALREGARMLEAAKRYKAVVLMHMLGDTPRSMQADPRYTDVVGEICAFFREREAAFAAAGGESARIWFDPGIGFGKTVEHNWEILQRLEELCGLGHPLLVGASRKSFLGKTLGSDEAPLPVADRLGASLAVACRSAQAGAACVRVHDVAETRRCLEIWARARSGA